MKRVYRGAKKHSLTHSLDFVNYFIYGNYNVPYYNAADQCIRLSPKMASLAWRLRILKTMCFSFYDRKTPSWNSELKEIQYLGNTRPRNKVDIEVLKATNCSLKSFKHFVCQARNQDMRLLEPGRELRTSNGVFGTCKYATSW